jgi:hypothetical protein
MNLKQYFGTKSLKLNLHNYKVVDHMEGYNFDISLSSPNFIWKNYELFLYNFF